MAYKRKRTPAVIETKSRYELSIKKIQIRFKLDSPTLEWLRSRVKDESELPNFIKQMLDEAAKS